jgi:hypothetical protein
VNGSVSPPAGRARATAIAAALLLLGIAAWFAPVLLPGPQPWFGKTLLSLDERRVPPFARDADAGVATRPQNLITSDLQGWILSHAQAATDRMRRGELPLWDEHELLGRPLHADASFPTFYPPDWIGLATTATRAYAYSSALHVLLAALGMLLLLRRAGLPAASAAVGALAYGAGGWMAVHLHVPHFVRSAAWLPWIVLASLRLAERPSPRRAALLAAAVGLTALAGYPQLLGIMLLAAGLAACAFVVRVAERGARLRAAGWHLAAFAVGGLLGAVELVPVAELHAASLRSENLPDEIARAKSLRPIHLASLVAPDFQGHPVALQQAGLATVEEWPPAREFFATEIQDNYVEDTLYGGVVTLLLAFVAVVASRRRTAVAAFAALFLLALLIATATPLQPLFRAVIPGLGAGSPKRVLLLAAFGLAGLGALGLEPLCSGDRRARVALLASGLFVAALCGAGLLCGRMLLPAWNRGVPDPARLATLRSLLDSAFAVPAAFALAAAALAPWFVGGRRACVAVALLIALLAFDLARFGRRFDPFQPPAAEGRATPVVDFLARPESRGRTLRFPSRLLLPASLASKWGVASVDGIQALIVRETGELLDALEPGVVDEASRNQVGSFDGLPDRDADAAHPPDPRFLAKPLTGLLARWIVVDRPLPPELGFALAYDGRATGENLGVYEHPRALPEAFFADRVCVDPDKRSRLARLAADDFAPARVAVVDAEADVATLPAALHVAAAAAPAEAAPAATVKSERVRPELLRVRVETPAAGVLVVNQAFFRGWRALVDGREQPPIRVDHALTGVVLGAGAHDVELAYRPASFVAGAGLSGAALAALIVLLLWKRTRPDARAAADALLSSSAARPPDRAPGTTALAPDPRG